MNKNKQFELQGLKIDKERVLTYSQLCCPLDCRYCFVNELNTNQEKDVSYLTEDQFELMAKLPEEVELIMLGCDTEFFQSKKGSLEILKRLVEHRKDISVITKLDLDRYFLEELAKINQKLRKEGNLLVFSETISCLDSYKKWEPKTPNPRKRIETLFSQLCDQFMIRRNYAKSFDGFKTRILSKITSLTTIQYINKFIFKRNINNIKISII